MSGRPGSPATCRRYLSPRRCSARLRPSSGLVSFPWIPAIILDMGRKSIFPVQYRDLGQEIWSVDIDDDAGPLLLLNSKIPALMHRVHENPLVAGSLLPAAFRIVLLHIAHNTTEDDEDGAGWKTDWMRFCSEGLGVEDDPGDLEDDDARDLWVDDVVRRYCETKAFVEKAKQMTPGLPHG
jgi:hypothetical protein